MTANAPPSSRAGKRPADGVSREALVREVLDTDRRIYQAILAATSDEWLRVDLSNRQLKVLLVLFMGETSSEGAGGGAREGATMTQLATTLDVSLPTATGVIDRLVEHGLVRRDADPADRRLVLVSLSPAGRSMMDRLRNRGRDAMAMTLERLGDDDLRLVARALDLLLTAALDALPGAHAAGTNHPLRGRAERAPEQDA